MVFLIFFTFFATFLEFYITRWVGTKRNYNFYFLSFSAFSNLFWPEMKPPRYFFNFLAILLEFSITCRAGMERNDNFYFLAFPSFPNLFWFNFLIFTIFLLFSWNFLLRDGRNEMERKFLFSPFPGLPNLVWLEMKL